MLLYTLAFLTATTVSQDQQPPIHVLREAIHWLAKGRVSKHTARAYAKFVWRESNRRDIHSFLFLAFIHTETGKSWNPRTKSTTHDFGLTQVHVAKRGSARFLGREHELYDPETNIKEWGRLAHMWRNYHARSCGESSTHLWWAHLKWGYVVKDVESGAKALGVFLALLHRFSPRAYPVL